MNNNLDSLDNTKEEQDLISDKKNLKKQALQKNSLRKTRKTAGNKSKKNSEQDDKQEKQKQRQPKLQSFQFCISSNQNSRKEPSFVSIPNQMQIKISNLEQDLNKKNHMIQKLKIQKDTAQQKYSMVSHQKKRYAQKAKKILQKTMKQVGQMRRKEKSQVDLKLGYYKEGNYKTFIEGQQIANLRKKLSAKQRLIKQLENQKQRKSLSVDNKDKVSLSLMFHEKQLIELRQRVANKQFELDMYKQRLRLAQKQKNSKYAQQGWPIVKERFLTMELLGSGGFGQVYKCFDLESSDTVALKLIRFNQNRPQEEAEQFRKHVDREVKTQEKLNHSNIVKFIEMIQYSDRGMVFVLEYCDGPELSTYIKKHKCIQEREAKQIIKQILSAIVYLSNLQPKVIHYDLKPSNVIFHNGQIKLLDFGLCKLMQDGQTRMQLTSQGVGTYWYLPPETFDQYKPSINSKVDVWAIGVIFFELLYGKKPFCHGIAQTKIYNEGLMLKATQVDFPSQTPKKHKVSQIAKQFIRECLKYSMDQRLSPQAALHHSYMKK